MSKLFKNVFSGHLGFEAIQRYANMKMSFCCTFKFEKDLLEPGRKFRTMPLLHFSRKEL